MNVENIEKNLWDQIRSLTQVLFRLFQWGLTTLVGVQTAIVFIRKDYAEMLKIPNGKPLAPQHYLIGTCVLLIVAIMFFLMTKWISRRLLYYIDALRNLPQQYPNENIRIYPDIPHDTK
jgi:hypothetical protein